MVPVLKRARSPFFVKENVVPSWLHRCCAGLSKTAFNAASRSKKKFLCPTCKLLANERDLMELRTRVDELENKLSVLLSKSSEGKHTPGSYTAVVGSDKEVILVKTGAVQSPRRSRNDTGRKFNIIVHGVEESQNGSSRAARQINDMEAVIEVLSFVESLSPLAIKDLFRLGKFSKSRTKPRPLMVKFVRAADANSIISKSVQLRKPYFVKPDRSLEERKKDKCLLDVRWSLLQSGYDRSSIKIRYSSLYLNNNLVGKVDSTNTFQYEGDNPVSNEARSTSQSPHPTNIPQTISSTGSGQISINTSASPPRLVLQTGGPPQTSDCHITALPTPSHFNGKSQV